MKKVLFAVMAVGLIASASSCKKCGYCDYHNGQRSSATCKQNGVLGAVDNTYQQEEANCKATAGATWEITK